ncbi:MAG: hypothetical protein EG824_09095 [Deltaproteobacteria bacterium]|nr:hypothetical protein [Deltaproteobacteria bacterium]
MRKRSLVYVYLTFLTSILLLCISTTALAQNRPDCPAELSSLMPGNAVKVTCQYNAAGIVGMGFAAANLPFKNICANQVTPNPGKISYDLKHYSGEAIQMFKMQIGPEERQRTQSKLAEFEKKFKKLKTANNPQLVSLSPLKTEKVIGGSISHFGYETDCSEGEKRSKPTVYLHAVGHNDSTAINIEVSGNISVDAAKAAATEVLRNFAKTNFSKLDK